jgi:hypothetical protein
MINRDATDNLVTEAQRRFPKIRDVVDCLRGIGSPFSTDDLAKRIRSVGVDLWEAVQMLWHAGVLGVEVVPRQMQEAAKLRTILPETAHKRDTASSGEIVHRWYFFEYDWDGEARELLQRYGDPGDTDARCVLHPKTYEYLLPAVITNWPLGI